VTQPGHSEIASSAPYIHYTEDSNKQRVKQLQVNNCFTLYLLDVPFAALARKQQEGGKHSDDEATDVRQHIDVVATREAEHQVQG
jgi:predicted NUDIX family NTP pyrophosphohydrolase